jgi:hypothetical protein
MENENIVKETALSVAKETVKEVYADTVQPTAKNVGVFFGTLSGFFNHVVMYPLKKLNIKYEQKAIAFEKEMLIQCGEICKACVSETTANFLSKCKYFALF